ncbi:MAG: hypothetical protein NVV82_15105 [Sporocytophaga sp.]|nr:hypothetical protein [Sporocytophaga sp.]
MTTEASGKIALWKSNGYANNTLKIASYPEINPLLNFNNALILGINDGIHGYELWCISSGGSKTLIKDIYPGPSSGLGNEIVIFNDWLFFKGTSPSGT